MATRLDRLVLLLDTGSTALVRNSAATQLAAIQKQFPHELYPLLGRVVPYLRSKSWDTRTAAARALGAILENVPQYEKKECKKEEEEEGGDVREGDELLTFDTCDLVTVLKNGQPLLGSAGTEYSQPPNIDFSDPLQLAKQKRLLNQRLGLGGEYVEDELVSAADVVVDIEETKEPDPGLSARQKNMLKRKAKLEAKHAATSKVRVLDASSLTSRRKSAVTTPPSDDEDYFVTPQHNGNRVVIESKAPTKTLERNSDDWPFEGLLELLLLDLYDADWETRHGAAMGLREVCRTHGECMGRVAGAVSDKRWLATCEDVICRIICVLALDRFADYVSDQIVEPVKESAAQALGAVVAHVPADNCLSKCIQMLFALYRQAHLDDAHVKLQARQGAMIGLKYVVAVRRADVVASGPLLSSLFNVIMYAVSESTETDAVACSVLVPILGPFIETNAGDLPELLKVLWASFRTIGDDLSSDIASVMDLLGKLCTFPHVQQILVDGLVEKPYQSLDQNIPYLLPYLRHTITSVRIAVLRILMIFLDMKLAPTWVNGLVLRLLFQNFLVEQNLEILELSETVWSTLLDVLSDERLAELFFPFAGALMELSFTPIGSPRNPICLDANLFLDSKGSPLGRRIRLTGDKSLQMDFPTIDAPMILGDIDLVGFDILMRSRIIAGRCLANIIARCPDSISQFYPEFEKALDDSYSWRRILASICVSHYASQISHNSPYPALYLKLQDTFKSAFSQSSVLKDHTFAELVPYLRVARSQCHSLHHIFVHDGAILIGHMRRAAATVQGEQNDITDAFGLSDAEHIAGDEFDTLIKTIQPRSKAFKMLMDARATALTAIAEAKSQQDKQTMRLNTSGTVAALALASNIPTKLNYLIQSVTTSVRQEENLLLQQVSAEGVSLLVNLCIKASRQSVVDKLIQNLCIYLCVDTVQTPDFNASKTLRSEIFSLKRDVDRKDQPAQISAARLAGIQRRGASLALLAIAKSFNDDLFEKIPILRQSMNRNLKLLAGSELSDVNSSVGQGVIDELSVVSGLLPDLGTTLQLTVLEDLDDMCTILESPFSVLRFSAARALGVISKFQPKAIMLVVVQKLLSHIADPSNVYIRQGIVECIYHLVLSMDEQIIPYVIFLIVPILGRMSDSDNHVRFLATETFATLVKLVPLDPDDPEGIPPELIKGREEERKFISQMLDGSKVENFEIPVNIKADLRKYQQEGVNWLAFLNRYHLHGILCDDMGLGKTLQTICIVASDHFNRQKEFEKNHAPEYRKLPSLVICPPTLTRHWQLEIETYAPFLRCVAYVGSPSERQHVRSQWASSDVVVTSYDICRNDTDTFAGKQWNYCVLDEGHVIKNAKTKLTLAVKTIDAFHRLILSGTPIQNNVLELWSLFDFLMPGFLGTERYFNERFAKPIAASRNSKSSSSEQSDGALALDALHKQVLPFLLRRLKEDVLADLPPKIIQDYYCDLSKLQQELYETFAKSQADTMTETVAKGKSEKQHIFQALQYMRKLCNHPSLVLQPSHPKYEKIMADLAQKKSSIKDIHHAPKLMALRDLLIDCGIGVGSAANSNGDALATATEGAVSQHRALIFFQLKEMLEMAEKDVLRKLLPDVSYLRLDGNTDVSKRQDIVQKFNSDASIDVLLLTTHVGGLGLNLTGADTVIFVEHDWNPMKDLQAMDRAHRIGQKKVVNVYRLITRGTLEEKIMGLQQFKLNIASSVINQQNSGLSQMNTDQILDLFNVEESKAKKVEVDNTIDGLDATGALATTGKKNILSDIPDLWDESQYKEEYNLDGFLQSLDK